MLQFILMTKLTDDISQNYMAFFEQKCENNIIKQSNIIIEKNRNPMSENQSNLKTICEISGALNLSSLGSSCKI